MQQHDILEVSVNTITFSTMSMGSLHVRFLYDNFMDMNSFVQIIAQCKLVDSLLTRIEVKKAFVESQMKDILPLEHDYDADDDLNF